MKIKTLATRPNLELAWRRITTGGNQQYKRFYRPLYNAYELALDANLRNLRERLLSETFEPARPERIYLPKASGLHRPLTLLPVEDQIVLQAFANLAARRLQARREQLQFKVVFSNILTQPDSIFFFPRWQDTYRAFQAQVRKRFAAGFVWVGDFDLAAFYETISHESLRRTIYPRAQGDALDLVERCLQRWSSEQGVFGYRHGIPQGPIASDLLAEYFLLPVDEALHSARGYLRYVDDVRLFGQTEDEVRTELIALERHCRGRGLIPQVGKFAIRRVRSVDAALGMLPSVADPHHEDDDPQHEIHACAAALDMLRKIDELNHEREAEALEDGIPFLPMKIGLGINTGTCVVGNMGSDLRFDYSVLGDPVNLASRLEGQTKTYGVPIIIGARTAEKVNGHFAALQIDLITVKGKHEPESIYALVGDSTVAGSEGFKSITGLTQEMLARYRDRDWSGAENALQRAKQAEETFGLAGVFDLYQSRIEAFRISPPPPSWDGVFAFDTK